MIFGMRFGWLLLPIFACTVNSIFGRKIQNESQIIKRGFTENSNNSIQEMRNKALKYSGDIYLDKNLDMSMIHENNVDILKKKIVSEFESGLLELEEIYQDEGNQKKNAYQVTKLRGYRKLVTQEENTCFASAIKMRDDNSVLKDLSKAGNDKCKNSGTRSITCDSDWYKSDWPSQEETCHSLQGVAVRYEKMTIKCTSRKSSIQNGARISITFNFNYVPYCFPEANCTSTLPNICSTYASRQALVSESFLKRQGYYNVNCIDYPVNCESVREDNSESSKSSSLVIILATTIPVGVILFLCIGINVRKKYISKKEETTSHADSPKETKMNQKYFGVFKGWLRDKYFFHLFFYFAIITWVTLWIVIGGKPCEKSRWGRSCNFRHWAYLWREPDMKPILIIVLIFLYIFFMFEYWNSSTAKYLSNINHTESLMQILERLYKQEPELSWSVSCYHMESRTVTSTDSKGNSTTTIEWYPVVTYGETEKVKITSWEDISIPLKKEDVSIYELTKVKISIDYEADGNFDAQGQSLKDRNRHRDVMCDLTCNFSIPGLNASQTSKEKMMVYVDLKKKPALLSYRWCSFFHWTVVGSFPYRLWVSGITGMTETTIQKFLHTHWDGFNQKSSTEE